MTSAAASMSAVTAFGVLGAAVDADLEEGGARLLAERFARRGPGEATSTASPAICRISPATIGDLRLFPRR
jgi:hypothetical protein